MTDRQKNKVWEMRAGGYGYTKIARELGLSENTVKSFCRRKGLNGTVKTDTVAIIAGSDKSTCLCCGVEIRQNPGRKVKKFCSDKCRNKWWNSHLEQVERKAYYEFMCVYCKKPFTAYGNAGRKYCSHACYVADRFGGGQNAE